MRTTACTESGLQANFTLFFAFDYFVARLATDGLFLSHGARSPASVLWATRAPDVFVGLSGLALPPWWVCAAGYERKLARRADTGDPAPGCERANVGMPTIARKHSHANHLTPAFPQAMHANGVRAQGPRVRSRGAQRRADQGGRLFERAARVPQPPSLSSNAGLPEWVAHRVRLLSVTFLAKTRKVTCCRATPGKREAPSLC